MSARHPDDGNLAALDAYEREQEALDRIEAVVDTEIAAEARYHGREALSSAHGAAALVTLLNEQADHRGDCSQLADTLTSVLQAIRSARFTLSHLTPGERLDALYELVGDRLRDAALDALNETQRDERFERAREGR